MTQKLSPFDFLNAINDTKENLITDDITEKAYSPFMVNRGLSYFQDTVLIANEMNLNAGLDNRIQYDFLMSMVRKRKRFSKWAKAENDVNLEIVKEFYGYSNEKARNALTLLTQDQVDVLKQKLSKGGTSRR